MPTTPYARLLLSIDGGAATSGGVEATAEASVQLVYESTVGWPASPPPYAEIFEYPEGWEPDPLTGWVVTEVPQPSGATASTWRYYGTTPPPAFAAPSLATWGKVETQLVVGGGLKAGVLSADMTSRAAVLVRSAEGLEGPAYREESEFGAWRMWVASIKKDLKLISTQLGAVGALTEAQLRAVSATLTAALPVNGQKITGLADPSDAQGAATKASSEAVVTFARVKAALAAASSALGINGQALDAGTITSTESAIGNTPTRGVTIINATNSGTQWGAQFGWSAINGGAQLNAGFQFEPQSSSRFIVRCAYLVGGTGVPSSSGPYWDLSDPNLGNGWFSDVFGVKSGGAGFRFLDASNRGGFDQDGSNNIRIKSYSGPGFVVELYSDAGSTLVATPISFGGTGKGRVVATPDVATSSGGAVLLRLNASQNVRHTTTEITSATFTGAVAGMSGAIEFVQGGTGYAVTLPTSGAAVEYDAAIQALGYSSIVSTSTNHRTVLHYYVTDTPIARVYIWHRSVSDDIP